MAISGIQGTIGSGKSAFAVSRGLQHLRAGGVVASNFELVEGWSFEVAKRSFKCRFFGVDPYEYASDLHSRWRVVGNLEGVEQATTELIPLAKGKISQQFEGHGLLLLDESQLLFNSRDWQKNMDWIVFFSQSRKKKWDIMMVAHNLEMIDKQIRDFIEYDVRFRNLNKVKIPLLQLPITSFLPWDNLFLSIWRYYGIAAGSGNIFQRSLSRLDLWEAQLYDSMKIFRKDEKLPSISEAGPAPALRGPVRQSHKELSDFFKDVSLLVESEHPFSFIEKKVL
ncbi:hypothetical protein HTZ97_13690 [Desulfuromonas acetoxidans]|uniref:zonular occludens toxin domain-containing protein n=1 Tax=Desulfuromonas acetoxidans TaxID=891 RepID=UPI0015942796|nr:zonular occludens toxin domain-containing protein [Desulfuromonas acetoxidans]MBF0644877.1 hypothetical protein [Desulfuromonas acetoxidans]NVD25394.1 hypothetical protein [Desulfuromonas acetoxidans]NVE17505.1 hypothetical protein [Desulfuromonas acetoxidans]